MKKFISFIMSAILVSGLMLTGIGCGDEEEASVSAPAGNTEIAWSTEDKTDYMQSIRLPDYVTALDDNETAAFTAEGNSNKQGSCYKGIAVSSYYSTKINGEHAYTYMISTAESTPHSVVFLDVSEDRFEGGKTLLVEVTSRYAMTKAIVLPEKLGVTPVLENANKASFTIGGYGTYTMVVDEESAPERTYTVFVRPPEKVEVPYGYTLIEYKPGLHFFDPINLKSNTILYLHAGALLVAKNPLIGSESVKFIGADNAQNVKIVGHGIVDYSQAAWHAGRGLYMNVCSNVEVDGITLINSTTWTMTYMYCKDLTINDCIIFGYRQNSDGCAICSSENVTVSNCFARSGDDLFEVKTYQGGEAKNITFENCVAWPDNCRGFGIVQETFSNISGVTYKNCSLLYQLKDWSEKMAAFVVTAGESGSVSDLTFEDCDLFYSSVYAIRFSVGDNDETMGVRGFNNTIKNVTFKNCAFKNPASGRGVIKFRNTTADATAISGIVFDNCTFRGTKLTAIGELTPTYEGYTADEVPPVTVK